MTIPSRPFARISGWVTLGITLALGILLISIGNADALFILAAPALSGLLAVLRPSSPPIVLLAGVLLLVGLMPMLHGGYGALYLPPGVMLVAVGVSSWAHREGSASRV